MVDISRRANSGADSPRPIHLHLPPPCRSTLRSQCSSPMTPIFSPNSSNSFPTHRLEVLPREVSSVCSVKSPLGLEQAGFQLLALQDVLHLNDLLNLIQEVGLPIINPPPGRREQPARKPRAQDPTPLPPLQLEELQPPRARRASTTTRLREVRLQ